MDPKKLRELEITVDRLVNATARLTYYQLLRRLGVKYPAVDHTLELPVEKV